VFCCWFVSRLFWLLAVVAVAMTRQILRVRINLAQLLLAQIRVVLQLQALLAV
jgi:hypothetical protein